MRINRNDLPSKCIEELNSVPIYDAYEALNRWRNNEKCRNLLNRFRESSMRNILVSGGQDPAEDPLAVQEQFLHYIAGLFRHEYISSVTVNP